VGWAGDGFTARALPDEIMYELMQLSGQEYVDQYAAKVKAAQGKDTGFGARERAAVRELGDRVPGTRAS
jgi:1-acyl-sn-glycerol-3-phosphate acyltransferase